MSDKKLCFIIGPIGGHKTDIRADADKLLKLIIKPTFSTNFKDYKVVRADEISQPGMVDSQVISSVIDADLVIADLSTKNANAFYELGIRHLLQKPVIHKFRRNELPPADIAAYRGIEFDLHEKEDITAAKSALRKAVLETQSAEFHIENPVTRSRAMVRMKEHKEQQREELLQLANGTQYPISHLQGMIEHRASTTGEVVMPPDSWQSYLDDVFRSQAVAKKLGWAINQLKLFF
ncbi:hypothetical protein QCM80_46060 [Bradyrhizobium sp. SSUT112]|uniref:hypothetical protein n=1 Tax=Bradyrhizobium sp. SSUT112 TaxID=3040604 RepID=UPI00244A6B85|nr:hypothetical protein [Bradyrhizobium sp. SSUT112]MDH2357804.1 hypothetical protein [Bradyrhizobium sp. SSUT112]